MSFILFLCFSVGLALSIPAIRVYRAFWGMRTALRKTGRFDSDSPLFGRVINTVERVRLRDLF